jgi:NhaP-type Na+/H+ or K+/H+ antiporter
MLASLTDLPALAFVFAAGALAQWVAFRLRIPAILLLLLCGFAAGPITGWLDPDAVFGSAFRPMVSLAVALILFEGGLTLRFDELRGSGNVVRDLVSVGALVTWVLATAAAMLVVGVGFEGALLIGAILVLTGPTVVIPLVRHVRPRPPLGAILRWEGILIDPIGALLALLVLEALTAPGGAMAVASGIVLMLVCGGGIGLAGGLGLARAFERYLVPDALHVPVTFGAVAATFALSNELQAESGLLAVTVMGITLGNRRRLDVAALVEWKEQLTSILLSVLFISIAARLSWAQVSALGWRAVAFTAVLVVVVRPLAVAAATWRSRLAWRERAFLMAVAPRGIVVAAVTSEFSLHFERSGHTDAAAIVALVFPVIVLSVCVYGLLAGPIARRLGVADADPQGVLLVGAGAFARELGASLHALGIDVLAVDTNPRNAALARTQGLRTWHGSVLSSRFAEEAELAGIGNVLALTPSAEVNRLALRQLQHAFGRARAFRVVAQPNAHEERDPSAPGRVLFGAQALAELEQRLAAGARIRATRLTEQFGATRYAEQHRDAVMLAVVTPEQKLQLVASDQPVALRPGCTVVALVTPAAATAAQPAVPGHAQQ